MLAGTGTTSRVKVLNHVSSPSAHHVVHRADDAQAAVVSRRSGREGAAAGVAVEPSFLHQHVEGLANGRPTHAELGAERVLGGNTLAVGLEVASHRIGDLQIPGIPGRKFTHRLPMSGCQDM